MKKIGLLTWHYFSNFGSMLQAYALLNTLKQMKFNAVFINYRDLKYGKSSGYKNKIKHLLSKFKVVLPKKYRERFYYPFISFSEGYLNQTEYIWDKEKLSSFSEKFDAIICGSDQIWAPNVFNPIYMIDFADGKKVRKISYAASIGLSDIPDDLCDEYKKLLSDFTSVSVRENTGMELLEDKCGIKSKVVLDPTFLLDIEKYKKIEKMPSGFDKNKEYVFCYFLNGDNDYFRTVKNYAEENNLFVYGVSSDSKDSSNMKIVENIGPREFLWLIHNAKMVFTDSYHGTIFSLLFHKDFRTFKRFKSEDKICQNSRIFQLGEKFGISDFIIDSDSKINCSLKVDYDTFEEKLKAEKEDSLNYLRKALE
ncbi:MAG: polysaccharide pyruvyl transferase family protein [Clostridia bacterium]|nr:polysaccharide pyruvyl transferase family protein [Clostridia bacterium]